MHELGLHVFHQGHGAHFGDLQGQELVAHYGDAHAEHAALASTAGMLDLSFRSRLCLTGSDRQRFLNGQVTNNVKDLAVGQGCYAALVTAKGKLLSDLHIYCLPNELLLDFEPALTAPVAARFEQFIIADDVQVVDVQPHYGLLSVQGPAAADVVARLELGIVPPTTLMSFTELAHPALGEIYCMNRPRGPGSGFDLFVPSAALSRLAEQLVSVTKAAGGRLCGWHALEMSRIEAGIPRFGVDMDETNLAPEAGLEARAISYTKGCYIGQEVIARIRTYGQVAKALRGLWLPNDLPELPAPGTKLYAAGREAGYVTSVLASRTLGRNLALGYVRREYLEPGTILQLRTVTGESTAQVTTLPFHDPS